MLGHMEPIQDAARGQDAPGGRQHQELSEAGLQWVGQRSSFCVRSYEANRIVIDFSGCGVGCQR